MGRLTMATQLADFPFLSALLLCCAVGLLVILSIPGRNTRAIKLVGAVFSGLTLVISIYLYIAYDQQAGGYQFVERVEWIPALGIAYHNAVDGFAAAHGAADRNRFFHGGADQLGARKLRVKEFFALIFLLVAGVFGMFMSLDLFLHFRVVRHIPFPHVPAHRRVGQYAQGVRRHEADPLSAGGQCADPAGHRLSGGQRRAP
jgi:NADH-quinone oxidoreductase subunit M